MTRANGLHHLAISDEELNKRASVPEPPVKVAR